MSARSEGISSHGGITIAVLLVFTLLVGIISWLGMFDWEDLHHCISCSFEESLLYIHRAYLVMNPRIGEYLMFLIGMSSDGVGAYNAQFLHYLMVPLFQLAAVVLIFKTGVPEERLLTKRGACICLFIALCMLGSKQNFYWHCGNMCWLYPCTGALLFFWIWKGVFHECFNMGIWGFIISVPLAVVVGMSNENTSVIAVLLFIGSGARACVRRKRFCLSWQYVAIAALLVLSAFVFYTAPCRAVRAASAHWELSFHNILFHSLLSPTNWLYTAIFYWREILILGVMLWVSLKNRVKLTDRRLLALACVLALLWGVLICAPYWGAPRSYTPLDLMLYTVMARILHKLCCCQHVGAGGCRLILATRATLTLTVLVPAFVLALAQYRVRCQIEEYACAAAKRGETRLVLHEGDLDISPVMPPLFSIPGFVVCHDLSPFIPLISISADEYNSTAAFNHISTVSLTDTHYPPTGDDVLNRGVAKRFGLEGIIYVK